MKAAVLGFWVPKGVADPLWVSEVENGSLTGSDLVSVISASESWWSQRQRGYEWGVPLSPTTPSQSTYPQNPQSSYLH